MATGIFTTIEEVKRKSGANASSVSIADDYIDDYTMQVESFINTVSDFNWSDKYGTLNVDVQGILKEVASNLAAIYVIQYDMSGFPGNEAVMMIDVLRDAAFRGLALLKDENKERFMKNA